MTSITTITCDSCNADLTYTSNCMDYRLVLANESKAREGNFATLMNLSPPIDRTMHYCGLGCLKRWVMKNVRLPEEVK